MLHQWLRGCLDSEDAATDQLLRVLVELEVSWRMEVYRIYIYVYLYIYYVYLYIYIYYIGISVYICIYVYI